ARSGAVLEVMRARAAAARYRAAVSAEPPLSPSDVPAYPFAPSRTRCTGTQAMNATAALQKATPTIIGSALPSMLAPTQNAAPKATTIIRKPVIADAAPAAFGN